MIGSGILYCIQENPQNSPRVDARFDPPHLTIHFSKKNQFSPNLGRQCQFCECPSWCSPLPHLPVADIWTTVVTPRECPARMKSKEQARARRENKLKQREGELARRAIQVRTRGSIKAAAWRYACFGRTWRNNRQRGNGNKSISRDVQSNENDERVTREGGNEHLKVPHFFRRKTLKV